MAQRCSVYRRSTRVVCILSWGKRLVFMQLLWHIRWQREYDLVFSKKKTRSVIDIGAHTHVRSAFCVFPSEANT